MLHSVTVHDMQVIAVGILADGGGFSSNACPSGNITKFVAAICYHQSIVKKAIEDMRGPCPSFCFYFRKIPVNNLRRESK